MFGFFLAIFFNESVFKDAEGDGWLGCGAGFADDVEGEIVAFDGIEDFFKFMRGETVASEEEVGFGGFVVRFIEVFVDGAGAEVAAADADTNEVVGSVLDFFGDGFDFFKFGLVEIVGDVEPITHGVVFNVFNEFCREAEV